MPLDALNGRHSGLLADHMTSIGIIPVPMDVLERHKAEQIRLNPPNILFTHKPYVAVGLLVYVGMLAWGASSGGFLMLLLASTLGGFVALFTTAIFAFLVSMGTLIGNITLRGPAQWIESYAARGLALNRSIPEPIREVTEYVRQRLQVYVIQGDLIQRNQLLDPYIVIQLPSRDPAMNQRVCLGVWDGERILHCAQIIRD